MTISAGALLGAALLAPMSTATAAGETCQGQAATIVGTLGGQIVGTEGGDDVVCATGRTGPSIILGAGADTFHDLDAALHVVFAGTEDGTDTEADVIRISNFSLVTSGMTGQPNADTIDLAVAGYVFWNGIQTAPGAVTACIDGDLFLRSASDVRAKASGSVTGADTSLTWTGDFDDFAFATQAARGTFTFRGTDAMETSGSTPRRRPTATCSSAVGTTSAGPTASAGGRRWHRATRARTT